jgi:hypothetical protein
MYVNNNTKGSLAIVENKALWITARAKRNPSGFYTNKKESRIPFKKLPDCLFK